MIKNIDEFLNLTDIVEIYNFPLKHVDEIPDEMPKLYTDYFSIDRFYNHDASKEMRLKDFYNSLGMYGFVSWRWINPFVEWLNSRKCIEVMAGRGWLSYALRQKGIDVIATDNFSWSNEQGWDPPITEVIELDAIDSVEKYGKNIDILIMSWPYMDDTAYRVIKKLNEINPNAIIVYVGEGPGGCTADDNFFDYFETLNDEKFYEDVAPHFQSWYAIHDCLQLGRYST